MTDCEKRNINCPPRYKNIGSSNFGDEKKVTAELLYQFCKNDSYLYDQVKKLWDKTDPEHRKRFYAPYYMDTSKSYGIEPLIFDEDTRMYNNKVSINDIQNKLTKPNGKIENAYHLSNAKYERYIVDFNPTNDQTVWEMNSNGEYDTLVINDETIIEDNSTLRPIAYEDEIENKVVNTLLPQTSNTTITGSVPFTLYKTETTGTKKTTKKKVVTKKDVYGKLTLDASCDGPYHNWHSNSVWYIGYNRHKNYNIKNKWRKNPDDTTIPSICRAQTFKAEHNGELRKVVLLMRGSSKSVSPCIVEIRTVKKGKPTNKVLARTEQKFNHSSKSLVNFTFKKPCVVKKGTQYAIVVRSPLSNFNHCYWLGGWAHTCFSNNRKRAYYDGETFLSEDNGKTWIVHGKKEKCYGSHYYDWGFAEAPINFGFEVYIAPKTGTKKVTSYVPKTVNNQVTTTTKVTDYLTPSIELNYFEAGDYYVEFKPFLGNFYTDITCIFDIEPYEEGTNIGEYSWEIFNTDINEETKKVYGWQSFEDYCSLYNTNYNRTTTDRSRHRVEFTKALTFVKLRLKLKLEENVLDDVSEFEEGFANEVAKLKSQDGISAPGVAEWVMEVESHFGWKTVEEKPLGIRKLSNLEFQLSKKPSFKGYLRTLEYHPEQEGMLPACIWSEVDVDAKPKNKGECRIDIIHERNSIEHILLYHIDNEELVPYIIQYNDEVLGEQVSDGDYPDSAAIRDYIFDEDKDGSIDESTGNAVYSDNIRWEFIEYLQKQTPKVYLLPYKVTKTVENEETHEDEEVFKRYVYFFGDEIGNMGLDNYPSYPINSCAMNTENIQLKLKDMTLEKREAEDEEDVDKVVYTHNKSLTDLTKGITIQYKYNKPEDDTEHTEPVIVEELSLAEGEDYSINGKEIIFRMNEGCKLSDFIDFGENDEVTIKDSNYYLKDETNIIVEMNSYEYNEFQDYLIDYDTKTLHFYEPLALVEGDLTINYNPLWVRDLTPEDFPLKMDLWTEYYQVLDGGKDGNDNQVYIFEKCKLNECGKPIIEENVENPVGDSFITTSVSPLDNIREVDMMDYDLNSLLVEPLVEDDDYTVDYLNNRLTFHYPKLKTDSIIMVKYTPNLTDTGLSLGYRLSRPLYDQNDNVIAEDTLLDRTSKVHANVDDDDSYDDVYCLSNYFTTRT